MHTSPRKCTRRYGRGLLAALVLLALWLAAATTASARDAFPAWPPNHYADGWEHRAPEVVNIEPGAQFSWGAAQYEYRLRHDSAELWGTFGSEYRPFASLRVDDEPRALIIDHPWRGIHLLIADGERLSIISPVGYYAFEAFTLTSRLEEAGAWYALAAIGGPVVYYAAENYLHCTAYNGFGYETATLPRFDKDGPPPEFHTDRDGDAVAIFPARQGFKVVDYRPGRGWETTEYESPGGRYELDIDADGLLLGISYGPALKDYAPLAAGMNTPPWWE